MGALAAKCGLAHPNGQVRKAKVPGPLLPEGAELVDVRLPRIGGMSAAVNLARSVEDAFEVYKVASERAGFEVTQVDFEVSEAEIWLRNARELGSIVIRQSACENASGVIISLVSRKDLEG